MIKSLIFASSSAVNTTTSNLSLLGLRVFAGLAMAFAHGLGKVPPSDRFIGAVENLGFPAPALFAWAAGLSELIGALLLVIGLATRPAALTLMFTMLVAAFGAHASDPFAKKEMALLYFFIFTVFFAQGGGKYSVDSKINP